MSAVPPAIRGVLALDAASATACPAAFVLSIAVSLIDSGRMRLCRVDCDCGRGRAVLVRWTRLPFELLRFELDRFDAARLLEPLDLARAPSRVLELLVVDLVVCAISLLVSVVDLGS